MRARKQSKAKAAALQAAVAAEAGPDDAAAAELEGPDAGAQQQQEAEPNAEQVAEDVEMLDTADVAQHDAAAGQSAAAAAGGISSADASRIQLEQAAAVLEQEPPDALKPVTNGLSRKRRASPAEAAAADCGGSRAAKAARQLEHQPGVHQGQVSAFAGASLEPMGLPADKQQQQASNPSGSQQQDGLQQEDQQQPLQQQPWSQFTTDGVPAVVQAVSAKAPAEADVRLAEQLLQRVVAAAVGMQLSELELLHARLSRVVAAHCQQQDRSAVLQQLGHIIDGL